MIILPTEKRFDWKNPPFVLLLLIFLNVFIFFLYQSGDDEKWDKSISIYLDNGLLKKEWGSYVRHLKSTGKSDELSRMQFYHDKNYLPDLAYNMLVDKEFAEKVDRDAPAIYGEENYSSLLKKRHEAVKLLYSASAERFGLIPNDIGIVNLVSHQFMHGDFMHLLGNMFFLVICGFAVEAAIGHGLFLLFYLLSGVAGGLAYAAIDFSSPTSLIGASGAISGVMAMYLWIFRLKKIEFFYWFYLLVGYVRLPALMVLPLYVGKELFDFVLYKGSGVAYMAHAGGFVSASLLMAGLLLWKPQTLDDRYIEEDQTIDPFRQKLAAVYQAMEAGQFPLALKKLQEITGEYPKTFSLSLLKYHLTKMNRGSELQQLVKELLAYNKLDSAELRRQEQVWLENGDAAKGLADDELVKLGMRFSALDGMASAENIFAILREKGSRHEMLGVFARKLAVNYERLGNREKSARYSGLAEACLNGGQS